MFRQHLKSAKARGMVEDYLAREGKSFVLSEETPLPYQGITLQAGTAVHVTFAGLAVCIMGHMLPLPPETAVREIGSTS